MKAKFLLLLRSLYNAMWNAAEDAGISLILWFVWNYIGVKLTFLETFVLVWSFGILMRVGTFHLKPPKVPMLFRVITVNNHQYIAAADPAALLHDSKVEMALQTAKLKSCSGSRTQASS